jgi:hypothetical protein
MIRGKNKICEHGKYLRSIWFAGSNKCIYISLILHQQDVSAYCSSFEHHNNINKYYIYNKNAKYIFHISNVSTSLRYSVQFTVSFNLQAVNLHLY